MIHGIPRRSQSSRKARATAVRATRGERSAAASAEERHERSVGLHAHRARYAVDGDRQVGESAIARDVEQVRAKKRGSADALTTGTIRE
jgi:hypothetical protein